MAPGIGSAHAGVSHDASTAVTTSASGYPYVATTEASVPNGASTASAPMRPAIAAVA